MTNSAHRRAQSFARQGLVWVRAGFQREVVVLVVVVRLAFHHPFQALLVTTVVVMAIAWHHEGLRNLTVDIESHN